ncbi:hypothetical protein J6590_066417 [Homalodisca vitripennis]|nr:hypothetical protein J6590_066417 [Homalodisca vitripennis]
MAKRVIWAPIPHTHIITMEALWPIAVTRMEGRGCGRGCPPLPPHPEPSPYHSLPLETIRQSQSTYIRISISLCVTLPRVQNHVCVNRVLVKLRSKALL